MSLITDLRGRIERRYLVVYRVDPDAAALLVPTGAHPLEYHGATLVSLCYTRLAAARSPLLPRSLRSARHHLAWRIPIQKGEEARRGVWVPRRETSSWLSARCSGALSRSEYHQARFELNDDDASLQLTVLRHPDELVLSLRARRGGELRGSIFATPRQAREYMAGDGPVTPPDPLAPLLDRLHVEDDCTLEPLAVDEVHVPGFEDGVLLPAESADFDSLFCVTPVRRAQNAAPSQVEGIEAMLPTGG